MKHWIVIAGILLAGVAAIIVTERRKVDVPPGPAAVLYLVADTEQELTRMPVHFTRMSDADEIAIGNQIAKYYEAERPDKNDPEREEVQRYLDLVGSRLASRAHRRFPYKFHYIPMPSMVNAFALPGGHVYIGEGLLSLMDSEDELASVLGHEIEHIDHYHCAERAQQESALRKLPLSRLFGLPIELFEAGYSKNQELEADREGVRLAVESGYSASGAIRMLEAFESFYHEIRARAKNPGQELAQTVSETLDGYFRTHPLTSERVDQIQKMIAEQRWPAVAERDLQVAYISWARKAEVELSAHEYEKSKQLANHSLKIKAGNRKALQVLARAEFSQAEFKEAAANYRQLLDPANPDADTVRNFALSLAAADKHAAKTEFQNWALGIHGEPSPQVTIQLAGLSVLAGDTVPAHKAAIMARQSAQQNTSDFAPSWMADLAWWYYLAGDYSASLGLINEAIQQRPGDLHYRTEAAWVQIEQKRLADAMDSLGENGETSSPERTMARAVLHWQEKNPDEALRQFETATISQPEWQNQRWVQGLYSPLVADSVRQMQAERERRKKMNLARTH